MKGGWAALLVLLIAFLFIPSVHAALGFLPIAQTAVLLFPAIAVCTLLGWAAGGSVWLALGWVLVGGAALVLLPGTGGRHLLGNAERGWVLVYMASFGLISSASTPRTPFFARAMSGLLLTLAICTTIMGITGSRMPVLPLREAQMAPALLCLESLAALTLAWAVYHRIARAPIGPPFGTWYAFRFNDRYVWALVAGVIFLVCRPLVTMRALGLNLVVFFGTLYALRIVGAAAYRCYMVVYSSRLRAG